MDLGIHGAVSIKQTHRDFGTFQVIEWIVVDKAGYAHTLTIYSDARIAIEVVEAPPEIAVAVQQPSKRDIRTSWESTPACWSAIDANSYDGAPDANGPIGYGKTEAEAIQDLRDQLDDATTEGGTNPEPKTAAG